MKFPGKVGRAALFSLTKALISTISKRIHLIFKRLCLYKFRNSCCPKPPSFQALPLLYGKSYKTGGRTHGNGDGKNIYHTVLQSERRTGNAAARTQLWSAHEYENVTQKGRPTHRCFRQCHRACLSCLHRQHPDVQQPPNYDINGHNIQ